MSDYQKKYNPFRSGNWNYGGKNWRLSRSKIDLYVECPRCFYLDNKLGTGRPRGPAFTLNVAVDTLLKREFDIHRVQQTPHILMQNYGVEAVPFAHPDMDTWRENFKGIEITHEPTGFRVSGAVDDVWINQRDELIVVDYKATSKNVKIATLADSAWEDQYRRQMGVYQWLLRKKNFNVSRTGYFVYANANAQKKVFAGKLEFEITLVPCEGEDAWIDTLLPKIKESLESEVIPSEGQACEFCPYRKAAGEALQKIHRTVVASSSVQKPKSTSSKRTRMAVSPSTATLF